MTEGHSLHQHMLESQIPSSPKEATAMDHTPLRGLKRWKWWILVALNIIFLLVGQAVATLLGRFYYDEGGNSKWMATLVQTIAFPALYIPLFLFRSSSTKPLTNISTASTNQPSFAKLALIYVVLGLFIAGDNMMYSVGLLYLPVSTYSLLCATQLAFNAIFSFFINAQKFTALILNSVVILTFSAVLLAFSSESEPTKVSKGKYILGFVCTLGASALYSLILCLMQLSFQKFLKKETFSVVLNMQIYTALVATCACVVGLFASGEWSTLTGEMLGFKKGRVSYVMTLVWTAVAWQIASVGVVGLIFVVSSLFSNVISTMSLPIVPIFAVIFFHDKIDGIKVVSLLMALWGSASYIYQNYLDDAKLKAKAHNGHEVSNGSTA
ncbi:Purine permease [Thalictrum thalictroides]|uniref:Probable purine permease n=1 Tax=Thalictrum thalictroides TaxID=46969 RepID=A0A7J6W3I2_THATH|nr:Purine permease [Thalictrum thalictroides]